MHQVYLAIFSRAVSYDVSNYVFKGVPISEFVAGLRKDPNGTDFCLADENNPKNFLVVDDALVASLNETKKSLDCTINESPIESSGIAIFMNQEHAMGVSAEGPRALFYYTILRACGIAIGDHLSADSELGDKIISSFGLYNLKAYPLVEMHGETIPLGVIEFPDKLEVFVRIASKLENWNFIEDPGSDPETHERLDSALSFNLVKNLEWALDAEAYLQHDMWRENYCEMLINRFLELFEVYVEEDDCWTSDVGVTSTRYGEVHQYGGMKDGEMYLIVSGNNMSCYDEDGWSDPEEETPTAYKTLKELLFEDPDYPTNKYTPQFGG